MLRKWMLAAFAVAAVAVAAGAYHLFVMERSADHYRLLLESDTVEAKRLHYDEIHRFYLPWSPWPGRAERWLREDGHEWAYLGLPASQRPQGPSS